VALTKDTLTREGKTELLPSHAERMSYVVSRDDILTIPVSKKIEARPFDFAKHFKRLRDGSSPEDGAPGRSTGAAA